MICKWKNHRLLPAASPGRWLMMLVIVFMVGKGWSQNITKVEYFFDTDPGFNGGTQIAVDPPIAQP